MSCDKQSSADMLLVGSDFDGDLSLLDQVRKRSTIQGARRTGAPMETKRPNALLIGESPQGSSFLVRRLQKRGCECEFATSYEEACSLLSAHEFDLVLSPMRFRKRSLFSLIDLLDGSGVTLFYSHVVEEGCWWLPALRCGQKCFGLSALRPSEFPAVLDEAIE